MEKSSKVVIYVRLLDEGVPVARPTYGVVISDNVFRILPTDNYDPEDETWEFLPGSIVRCEKKIGPNGEEAWLAVERVNR